MTIITTQGLTIDVSSYQERMLDNLSKKLDIFCRTPICMNQDGGWFWWSDVGEFKDLEKSSVENLINELKAKNEH